MLPYARIVVALIAACPLTAESLKDGLSIVTSHSGTAEFTGADGQSRRADLHAVQTLSNTQIQTGPSSSLFLSLSNGAAIAVGERSSLQIESYQQRPCRPERESIEYEPSVSYLDLRLDSGQLAFSAEQLSPLSEITMQLPRGHVTIRSATGALHYGPTGTKISLLSGNLIYHYPNGKREFVVAPSGIRISDQSAQMGEVAERIDDIQTGDEADLHFIRAVEFASRRVIYKIPADDSGIPLPTLVALPSLPPLVKEIGPRPYVDDYFD